MCFRICKCEVSGLECDITTVLANRVKGVHLTIAADLFTGVWKVGNKYINCQNFYTRVGVPFVNV